MSVFFRRKKKSRVFRVYPHFQNTLKIVRRVDKQKVWPIIEKKLVKVDKPQDYAYKTFSDNLKLGRLDLLHYKEIFQRREMTLGETPLWKGDRIVAIIRGQKLCCFHLSNSLKDVIVYMYCTVCNVCKL